MNSARNDVLMDGLDDWVHFYRVHRLVYLANPDASVGELQAESLNIVADLVSAGLYQVGTVERGAGFVPWDIPIDEALDRIRAEYVGHYDETVSGITWPGSTSPTRGSKSLNPFCPRRSERLLRCSRAQQEGHALASRKSRHAG